MSAIMGVMMVLMAIGFLGFGHHTMIGGHGKDEQKQEVVGHNHGNETLCPDCPTELELPLPSPLP